jgi:hypothetical protein
MERRLLAAAMYGLAMFGVLNVMLPLVVGLDHLNGLFLAALATPLSVALLSFSIRQVFSPQGALLTIASTAGLFGAVYLGRTTIPPAPLSMPEGAVGHGTRSSYECLPPSKHAVRANQLDGLRCGSLLREPGGLKERVEHSWVFNGREIAREEPKHLPCDGEGDVFVSEFPAAAMPKDPTGKWWCITYTVGGQLVGARKFEVLTKEGISTEAEVPGDAGVGDGGGGATGDAGVTQQDAK